jgi:hypothetical protein
VTSPTNLEHVVDDALALTTSAADSHVWRFLAGALVHPVLSPELRRWLAYSSVVIGGDRFVGVLEPIVPEREPGEWGVVDVHLIIRSLCDAYPSRAVARRRVRVFQGRYVHRMRSVGVALPPQPVGNDARFTDELFRMRARLLAELEGRPA